MLLQNFFVSIVLKEPHCIPPVSVKKLAVELGLINLEKARKFIQTRSYGTALMREGCLRHRL